MTIHCCGKHHLDINVDERLEKKGSIIPHQNQMPTSAAAAFVSNISNGEEGMSSFFLLLKEKLKDWCNVALEQDRLLQQHSAGTIFTGLSEKDDTKTVLKLQLPRIGTNPPHPSIKFSSSSSPTPSNGHSSINDTKTTTALIMRRLMIKRLIEVIEAPKPMDLNGSRCRLIRVRGPGVGKTFGVYQLVSALRLQPEKFRVIYLQDCHTWLRSSDPYEFLMREVLHGFHREVLQDIDIVKEDREELKEEEKKEKQEREQSQGEEEKEEGEEEEEEEFIPPTISQRLIDILMNNSKMGGEEGRALHVRALLEVLSKHCEDNNLIFVVVTDQHDSLLSSLSSSASPSERSVSCQNPFFLLRCLPRVLNSSSSSVILQIMSTQYQQPPRFGGFGGFSGRDADTGSAERKELKFVEGFNEEEFQAWLEEQQTSIPSPLLSTPELIEQVKLVSSRLPHELFLLINGFPLEEGERIEPGEGLTRKKDGVAESPLPLPLPRVIIENYKRKRREQFTQLYKSFVREVEEAFGEVGMCSLRRCVTAVDWSAPGISSDLPYIYASNILFEDPNAHGKVRAISDLARSVVLSLHPESTGLFQSTSPPRPLRPKTKQIEKKGEQEQKEEKEEEEEEYNLREEGLGPYLCQLEDKFLFRRIWRQFSANDLTKIQMVSKAFYVLSNEESLWKALCVTRYRGDFLFKVSWKWTVLAPRSFALSTSNHGLKKKSIPFPGRLPVHGYASQFLYKRWYRAFVPIQPFFGPQVTSTIENQVERRSVLGLSKEEFIERYEKPRIPVILTDGMKDWKAMTRWQRESFSNIYINHGFGVDEVDEEGDKLAMRLYDYIFYADQQHDEDPIYMFDPHFADRVPELLDDYKVPIYFQEDFFETMEDTRKGRKERPPYRWICWGPTRSGSSFHIDPNGTSAWNALISGKKRWCLYPPGIAPPGVRQKINRHGEVSHDAPYPLRWYLEVYPYLTEKQRPTECMLNPGEIIFVPSGWWHQVLNFGDTIAVTQNYLNTQNFEYGLKDMTTSDKDSLLLAKMLHERMAETHPHLWEGFDVTKFDVEFSDSDSDSESGTGSHSGGEEGEEGEEGSYSGSGSRSRSCSAESSGYDTEE